MADYLLALDQGTSSTRAFILNDKAAVLSRAQISFKQYYPQDGWVEHDPEEIWQSSLTVCRDAMAKAGIAAAQIAGLGISNQRETTLLWERSSGKVLYNAIVWQDRRTAARCAELKREGLEALLQEKTGLLLDPYFSATKLAWLLENIPGARRRAEAGELAFGTIDSFLIWRLTAGKSHVTDATNASRTALFNIHDNCWDQTLLDHFQIPAALLPRVLDCCADFGSTDKSLFAAAIPICGVAGDQQAATIGQACLQEGMVKSTFGTGCFVLLNTGKTAVKSQQRLLTTIAYRIKGETTYGLEGSIFSAGSAVQWLRDGLGLIKEASETQQLASSVASNGGVYLVPAFTGLGAPHWDPDARAAILGLTRDSERAHIARACLESVAYQCKDLLTCMEKDANIAINELRVDGGMVVNDWLMQFLADLLALRVQRPEQIETTVLGAAFLAGIGQDVFSIESLKNRWQSQCDFQADKNKDCFDEYATWKEMVNRVLTKKII